MALPHWQVDICDWTPMASRMRPLQLANLVHTLFCYFDDALAETTLFKVDNMGDAWVCCGWLPRMEAQHGTLERDAACGGDGVQGRKEKRMRRLIKEEQSTVFDTMFVASCILDGVRKVGRERGMDLAVRIGIGTGECVAGWY